MRENTIYCRICGHFKCTCGMPPTPSKQPKTGAKQPIDRPCSACSAGDYRMEHHDHYPPFRTAPTPSEPPKDKAKCQYTGNICGTDTWATEQGCRCAVCQWWYRTARLAPIGPQAIMSSDIGKLRQYVVAMGGIHDKDCPCDDTCECSGKTLNDTVNRLCNLREVALPVPAEPVAGETKPIDHMALCECGHPLHRHGIMEPATCWGTPETLALRGPCDCKGFKAAVPAVAVPGEGKPSERKLYVQGRLDQHLRMKRKRPADPTYWDTHEERGLREELEEAASTPLPAKPGLIEATKRALEHVCDCEVGSECDSYPIHVNAFAASIWKEAAALGQAEGLAQSAEILRLLVEWEEDYRTTNHLGKEPPQSFRMAAEAIRALKEKE